MASIRAWRDSISQESCIMRRLLSKRPSRLMLLFVSATRMLSVRSWRNSEIPMSISRSVIETTDNSSLPHGSSCLIGMIVQNYCCAIGCMSCWLVAITSMSSSPCWELWWRQPSMIELFSSACPIIGHSHLAATTSMERAMLAALRWLAFPWRVAFVQFMVMIILIASYWTARRLWARILTLTAWMSLRTMMWSRTMCSLVVRDIKSSTVKRNLQSVCMEWRLQSWIGILRCDLPLVSSGRIVVWRNSNQTTSDGVDSIEVIECFVEMDMNILVNVVCFFLILVLILSWSLLWKGVVLFEM